MAKNIEEFSSQLSAQIWGHRFKDGQRGPEYVLEFLNVLYGTNYCLNADGYTRNKAINLRKFIFEGVKEGSKREVAQLEPQQKEMLYDKLDGSTRVDVIRDFFRNLEIPLADGRGKEADRSWYARSLYPIHENLLFFELRTKGSSIAYERNFYARGGELYYLMISYGTANNYYLRENIGNRFKSLLNKNEPIGSIINSIQRTLGDKGIENDKYPLKANEQKAEYPTLPVTDSPLFEEFAQELNDLLNLNLDMYDMFKLLVSLNCFQLMRYMYDRSKVTETDKVELFFDCLDGNEKQIQRIAADTFKDNELLIKNKFEEYFSEKFFNLIGSKETVEKELDNWKRDLSGFYALMGLSKLHEKKKTRVRTVLRTCNTYNDVATKLFKVVKEVISDSLKRHQLSIIRTLARDGGIGNFKAGSNYRYTMTDVFLQTLVLVNVKANDSIEFSEFLDILYKKYGFVIGEIQSRESGMYDRSKLNISYYHKNELALREKLKKNGLLVEYSDATAMIRNPYEVAEGVVVV